MYQTKKQDLTPRKTPTQQNNQNQIIFDHVLKLLQSINACSQISLTQQAIILTSFFGYQSKQLSSLTLSIEDQKNCQIPNVSFLSRDLNISIINTKKYFYPIVNKNQIYSIINFFYLFTFYSQIFVVIVVDWNKLINQKKKQYYQIFTTLGEILGKSKEGRTLHQNICLAIINKPANQQKQQKKEQPTNNQIQKKQQLARQQKYLQQFKKLLDEQGIANKQGKALLKHTISKKKIIWINEIKTPLQLITRIKQKIKGYVTNPTILTNLYKQILKNKQLQMIQKYIIQHPLSPYNTYNQIMNIFANAIQNRQIFSEDYLERQDAMQAYVLFQFPLKKIIEMQKKNWKTQIKSKLHSQFGIQAALFIFTEMYKTQKLFYQQKNIDYINYNKESQDIWDQYFLNQSVMSQIIINMFSQNTILHHNGMLDVAHFLQVYFQLFQCVPQLNIRQKQFQILLELQNNVLNKFMELFYQILSLRTKQLASKISQTAPKRLLRLTGSIKKLIFLLKQMSQLHRQPYQQQSKQIKDKVVCFASDYIFISWKCYEKYDKFWSREQKNNFMFDIEKLCRENYTYLENHNNKLKETYNIVKKINQYFAKSALINKKYDLAIQFFSHAKQYWKVIETYEIWLQQLYTNNQFSSKNISVIISRLAQLGLLEKARIWCYKFIDIIENNSQLIGMLQDFLQGDPTNVILDLKYNEIKLADQNVFASMRQILKTQDWLPMFEDN